MDMLESLLQPEIRTGGTVGLSMLAMLFSFVLSLLITVVYRRTFSGERYSQAFVHTIIMMSVIVSIVMNVVSDNAGVAFGLFAVFSLIRFRSEVTDAKDISYIFFGLCVGMTAGCTASTWRLCSRCSQAQHSTCFTGRAMREESICRSSK